MEENNNSNYDNINRIKERRLQRDRQEKIRIIVAFSVLLAVIILIVFAITSLISNSNKKSKEAKIEKNAQKTEIVNLMSYNSEKSYDEKRNKVTYVEPVARPVKHQNGVNDRLESVRNAVTDKKVCYLTFDDGPNNSITTQVLDVLRKYDIKATFFMVGTLIESNPDVARRIFEEGHLLANHSYSHDYKNIYANTEAFMSELRQTEGFIKLALDSEDDYFPIVRFPGGSHYAGSYKDVKKLIKEHLNTQGFYYCDWNALNGDAEGEKKDADGLFEYFKKNTNTDKNVVVLMHDAVSKQATVDSLPRIIEYMAENGYVFLRLDEDIKETVEKESDDKS